MYILEKICRESLANFVVVFKPGAPAKGWHAPGFLKLLLSRKSVCVFVCLFVCLFVCPPRGYLKLFTKNEA